MSEYALAQARKVAEALRRLFKLSSSTDEPIHSSDS